MTYISSFRVASLLLLLTAVATTTAQTINYCDVLHESLLFYEAQRSGRLPANNRVPWRGNSALGDCTATGCTKDANGDGNLAGGYYDAGDHVKFGLPMAFTTTALTWGLIEFESAVSACGELGYYLDTIKYATDWLIKAHTAPNEFWGQVGNGGMDHSYWGPPEAMTMERPAYKIDASKPGTELAMEAASALAAASIVFKTRNPAYSTLLLQHARQLYTFGDTYRGVYSDSIPDAASFYKSWSGFNDEIVWASLWMYRATGEATFLTKAKDAYGTIQYQSNGQSFDWDNKAPGAVVLMAKLTGEDKYKQDAQAFLNSWYPGGSVPYTPGGLAWIRQWGPNRYASGTAFLAVVVGNEQSNNWAKGQINYMLGQNPQSRSYVVGYGANSPKNPHHRAAHHSTTNNINVPATNTYVLRGALVGGPGQQDDYVDDRSDYIKNEVATDYNAAFTAALAGLAKVAGNKAASSSSGTVTGSTPGSSSSSSSSSSTASSSTSSTATTASTASSSTATGSPASSGTSSSSGASSGASTGGITVTIHNGASAWWLAVAVSGGGAVTQKVELKDSGSVKAWTALEATTWGYFVYQPSAELKAPASLRVTSASGVVVELNNVITALTPNAKFSTAASYGSSGAAATSASASSSSSAATSASTAATSASGASTSTASSGTATSSSSGAAPSPSTNTIKIALHSGSNSWWLAVDPRDEITETSKVEIQDNGIVKSWQALTATNWGAWVYQAHGAPLTGPISLRLTSAKGEQLVLTNVIASINPNAVIDSRSQYKQ